MRPINPGDRPDRPALQTGSLRSGLMPVGTNEPGRHATPTQRPYGVLIALGVVLLLIVLIVVARALLG